MNTIKTSFLEDLVYSEIFYNPKSYIFFSKDFSKEMLKNIVYYKVNKWIEKDKFCKNRNELYKLSKKVIFKKNWLLYLRWFNICNYY